MTRILGPTGRITIQHAYLMCLLRTKRYWNISHQMYRTVHMLGLLLKDLDDAEEHPDNPSWERFLSAEDEQILSFTGRFVAFIIVHVFFAFKFLEH